MKRVYKLACNFNTVEIEPTRDDLMEMVEDFELMESEEGLRPMVSDEELLSRLLQREYDILADIKPANTVGAAPIKQPAQQPRHLIPPSPKQCEWARNLGMKDPEKKSLQEVWAYIDKHK